MMDPLVIAPEASLTDPSMTPSMVATMPKGCGMPHICAMRKNMSTAFLRAPGVTVTFCSREHPGDQVSHSAAGYMDAHQKGVVAQISVSKEHSPRSPHHSLVIKCPALGTAPSFLSARAKVVQPVQVVIRGVATLLADKHNDHLDCRGRGSVKATEALHGLGKNALPDRAQELRLRYHPGDDGPQGNVNFLRQRFPLVLFIFFLSCPRARGHPSASP